MKHNYDQMIKHILHNAQVLTDLYKNIKVTVKKREENKQAWLDACENFHNSFDAFAFPGGLNHALKLLKKKDPSILPTAIAYLKADPYFHRSGYIKGQIATQLKKYSFDEEQRTILQNAILTTMNKQTACHEFKYYCRLAIKLQNKDFLDRLQNVINQTDNQIILKRAKYLFNLLQTHQSLN